MKDGRVLHIPAGMDRRRREANGSGKTKRPSEPLCLVYSIQPTTSYSSTPVMSAIPENKAASDATKSL
jgi:hypothetical protein